MRSCQVSRRFIVQHFDTQLHLHPWDTGSYSYSANSEPSNILAPDKYLQADNWEVPVGMRKDIYDNDFEFYLKIITRQCVFNNYIWSGRSAVDSFTTFVRKVNWCLKLFCCAHSTDSHTVARRGKILRNCYFTIDL